MNRLIAGGLVCAVTFGCSQTPDQEQATSASTAISYPESPTVDHVDNYHGTEVADP